MRNDMSIQGVSPVTTTGDPLAELKDQTLVTAASAVPSTGVAPIYVSPALRLEPSLGLVVIEFRDSGGAVTNSIPTPRQLKEYKQYARIEDGAAHMTSLPVSTTGRAGSPASNVTRGGPGTPVVPATGQGASWFNVAAVEAST